MPDLKSRPFCEGLTDVDVSVVLAFAENNMRVTQTAKKLFLHRNTVQYHLDIVAKKTGLSPLKFYDLVKLVGILKEGADDD